MKKPNKKLVKVELTYWTYLPLPGAGSGSPDHSLPIDPGEEEDMTPDWGIDEGAEVGGGLPSKPSKEEILEILKEHEDEIKAKIDALKQEIGDRIPGIKEKLEAIKAEIHAKIEEIKSRPIDPGYGVEEGATPGQGLPDKLEALKESLAAKIDAIKAELADRVPGAKEKLEAIKEAIAEAIEDLVDRISGGGGGGGDCAQKIAAIKAAVKAKLEALKAELGDRVPGVKEKIEAAKQALMDKIASIPVDPGYGVEVPERAPKARRVGVRPGYRLKRNY